MSKVKILAKRIMPKKVYIKYKEIRRSLYVKHELKIIKKNGVQAILKLQEIMDNSPYMMFFDCGTVLGLIREGRIIGYDKDIDIGVKVPVEKRKEFSEMLKKNGCSIFLRFEVDELGVVEESYRLFGVKFDIFYYYTSHNGDSMYAMYKEPEKKYEKENDLSVVRIECPLISSVYKFEAYGKKLNIPNNPEEYLKARYGEDWRIPDKNYVFWKADNAKKTDYIGKRIDL